MNTEILKFICWHKYIFHIKLYKVPIITVICINLGNIETILRFVNRI